MFHELQQLGTLLTNWKMWWRFKKDTWGI